MINFYCNKDIFPNTAYVCLILKWKENVETQIGEFIVYMYCFSDWTISLSFNKHKIPIKKWAVSVF